MKIFSASFYDGDESSSRLGTYSRADSTAAIVIANPTENESNPIANNPHRNKRVSKVNRGTQGKTPTVNA